MRFDNPPHRFYGGVPLQATTLSLGSLDPRRTIVRQPTIIAGPDPFLQAITPGRDGLAVACECRFAWYGLADLCAQENIPCILGHALDSKAIHGGKAKTDTIDAHTIAVRLRGRQGLRPASTGERHRCLCSRLGSEHQGARLCECRDGPKWLLRGRARRPTAAGAATAFL